jgi:hypothetical protein
MSPHPEKALKGCERRRERAPSHILYMRSRRTMRPSAAKHAQENMRPPAGGVRGAKHAQTNLTQVDSMSHVQTNGGVRAYRRSIKGFGRQARHSPEALPLVDHARPLFVSPDHTQVRRFEPVSRGTLRVHHHRVWIGRPRVDVGWMSLGNRRDPLHAEEAWHTAPTLHAQRRYGLTRSWSFARAIFQPTERKAARGFWLNVILQIRFMPRA